MDNQAPTSPFLPGTNIQFAWDSTSLGMFKTCPRLYQYVMIEGWGSKDESIHLRFGIEMHQALQEFDILQAAGESREAALRQVLCDLVKRTHDWDPDPDTKAGKYKNRPSLFRAVLDYVDHYVADNAEVYILDNGKPAVELSFRFELEWGPKSALARGWSFSPEPEDDFEKEIVKLPGVSVQVLTQPYLLCGHLDRIVTLNDELYIADLKTTTSTPGSYYFDQYQPNNQMTLYTLASQVILGTPVKGIIIEAAQIAIGFTRFTRGMTYRTPDQLEEWLSDLRLWLRRAEEYAVEGYWPQNDTACDKFGGCRFREVCSKSPQVREKFLAAKFDKLEPEERWNPLKSRG